MKQQNDKVRFDELFGREMMTTLYSKFKEHIKQCDEKKSFNTVIENEVLTPSTLLTVLSKMQSEDIKIEERGIIKFLWANCFNVVYPRLYKEGHKFVPSEKLHLAGYTMFIDCMNDKDYPHEQAMELKQLSEDFINTSFSWGIKSFIKIYDEINLEETIRV